MTEKIVLIGAGSANFGLEAVSDIYRSKTLEGSQIVLHDTDKDSLKETQEVAESGRGFDSRGELNQFKPAICRFTCAKIKKLFIEKLQETCPGLVQSTEDAEKKLQEILEEVIGESGAKRQEVETIVRKQIAKSVPMLSNQYQNRKRTFLYILCKCWEQR